MGDGNSPKRPGEIPALRGENVKQFRTDGGTNLAVYYADPVHFESGAGWEDIDNRLTLNDRGCYENAANSLRVELPEQFKEESRVGVTRKGYTLRFGIATGGADALRPIAGDAAKLDPAPEMPTPQMEAVAASMSGLSYTEVTPGAALHYALYGDTLKESFLFSSAASMPELLSYRIAAEGLHGERLADGSVQFRSDAESVFYLRAPYLLDAAGAQSGEVSVTLEELDGGEYLLNYRPGRDWLEAAERAWPVALDPVISGRAQDGYLVSCYVSSMQPNDSHLSYANKKAGHSTTEGTMRTYVRWSGLPDLGCAGVVVAAEIRMYGTPVDSAAIKAHAVTGTWGSTPPTWNAPLAYSDRVLDYKQIAGTQYYGWDVTAAAKAWYGGALTNNGLAFDSDMEESAGNHYVSFSMDTSNYQEKPSLEILYRQIVGLEDYWTRRELSIDRAGTAYIGDNNGMLTLAEEDVSYASTICPVTISHIYNAAYAGGQLYQTAPGASAFSSMQAGAGWKLNIQQTVTAFDTNTLRYLDGDGTVHYFLRTGTDTYQDEDGLGLTITAGGSNYTMADRYGNIKYFGGHLLRYIQDANGNRVNYVYDSYDHRVNTVTRQLSGGSAETIATLSYNSIGVLIKITDGNGKETSYDLASGYKLLGITRPDGTTVSYTYDSNGLLLTARDNETLYSLSFGYDSRGLISGYSETGNTTTGVSVSVTGTAGIRNYRHCGKGRVLGDADDLITSYVFDYFGRTVCSSTRSADGQLIYSAAASRYTVNNAAAAANNRVLIGGGVGMRPVKATTPSGDWWTDGTNVFASPNLLTNGDMSVIGGWTLPTGASYVPVADYGHAIRLPGALNAARAVSQTVTVNTDGTQTYMFSAWAQAGSAALSENGRSFELRALLTYTDNSTEEHASPFCADSEAWQYNLLPIVPKEPTKTVSTITVSFAFDNNPNTAHFTFACLTKEPAQSFRYNADGDLISVATPNNATPSFSYQNADLVTAVTKGNGTLNFTYDSAHRMTKATNDGLSLSAAYSAAGNTTGTALTGSGTALTITSAAEYGDGGNRLTKTTDARGNSTQYAYGTEISRQNGTPTAVTDAAGTTVTTSYHASNGRVTGTALGSTVFLANSYACGRLSALSRTAGGAVQSYGMSYTAFGRPTTVQVGTRTLATYGYTPHNGQRSALFYGNGQSEAYSYDDLERLTAIRYNNGADPSVSFLYLGEGTLGKRTDHAAGRERRYGHDTLGRLLSSTEKTTAGTAISESEYGYDTANRVTQHRYRVSPTWNGTLGSQRNISYVYNSGNGSIHAMGTPAGTLVYGYDYLKRISSRTLKYAEADKLRRSYAYLEGGGTDETTLLVKRVQFKKADDTLLRSYGYSYDALGNITAVSGSRTESFQYDAQGQLVYASTGTSNSQTVTTYSYDGAGNILSKTSGGVTDTYTYGDSDWKDLLTAYNGNSITYDNGGNPTVWHDGTLFTWVNGRQLASAVNSGTGLNASYLYDADGLRLSKTVNGVEHKYVWVDGKLISEQFGDTALEFCYDEAGRPFAFLCNGTPYYYVTNLQGDVTAICDLSGTIQAVYNYDAYGRITSMTSSDLARANPLRYRSYYYDSESGLYYLKSRYYDPQICRFINADSLASTGQGFVGTNMFAYCGDNPVNTKDSSGKSPKWLSSLWGDIKDWVKNTFGTSYSESTTREQVIIGNPSPVTVTAGRTQAVAIGDNDKPVKAYCNTDVLDPIYSSVGIYTSLSVFGSTVSFDTSIGLNDIGVTWSVGTENQSQSAGYRLDLSRLRFGVEYSTTINYFGSSETSFTNISVNGLPILAMYMFLSSGQAIVPTY